MKIILAITGASGLPYAVRIAEELAAQKVHEIHFIITDGAKKLMRVEGNNEKKATAIFGRLGVIYRETELEAPIASGSFRADAMVVCPCSAKTLSAISTGFSHNLVCRAADVMIKERRTLVLVIREAPLSQIHLENMLKLSQAGVVIMPACPAFYPAPKSVSDMVDFVAGRTLDQLGIDTGIFKRWKHA